MPSIFTAVAVVSGLLPVALAQVPLASQHFTYTALPYQADPNGGERGTQFGYNICNSTTEGPTSLCQTAIINSIDDFCLWGPPEPNSLIGNVEGESVAWCTKAGYGTRVIPKGAITGLQFMKTPDYVQVTGFIQQDLINIDATDSGGELDPHGADQRGNPLGGLLFSNAWGGGMVQAVEWHNFMGGGTFCLKACDPSGAHAADYCQHVFDRIGCQYNAPAAYVDGTFLSCLGDNQDFPGVYTDATGATITYQQPAESLGAITTIPYSARIPASSSCTTYESASLFANAPEATVSRSSSSGSITRSTTRTGAGGGINTGTATGTRSASTSTSTNAASSRAVASVGALVGAAALVFAAL
ncbi:hypothetical protein M408DRAFT_332704 [Serendipita vermifera MAFF 305830]|uniref:Macrofage activating glycoprotein n=1 Tax=Serendipita vermifera MAFF 305830 TaxID=933852 RepID=A0A0C2W8Q9_SERVB|nr:hypothetical protein M408DRAFT_332704 [Serendipita vermifera MAFF 305830]